MKVSEIKKMSITERLQTMETLWGTLLNDEVDVDSPEWHGDILSERRAKIDAGEARFITLEKLREYRPRR